MQVDKRVVIKVGPGSIETGYAASVQIGAENAAPRVETQAHLPPAADIADLYHRWQQAYWQLGLPYRLEAHGGITNISALDDLETCRTLSYQLRDRVHQWLNGDDFRPIREKLLEQLNPDDTIRILLQTKDPLLQRLPWYELQFFERYRHSEVAVCALDYQQVGNTHSPSEQVRILAVLGDGTGLDTAADQTLLKLLPNADIHFLKEPTREVFNQALWDIRGWDILFFAGHSTSQIDNPIKIKATNADAPGGTPWSPKASGEIALNATQKLTIPQLKHALRKAIDRGLNTAIFNSCDGLGLAADLADLYIPQVLVMREPVPDRVAQAFLQGFLESFAAGAPFYLAVREAREKLQPLEAYFPCATWLPVIVQNPAQSPPTWRSLQGSPPALPIANSSQVSAEPQRETPPAPKRLLSQPGPSRLPRWKSGLASGILVAVGLLFARQFGVLETLELRAYDALLRSRPAENSDDHLLIITNTEADIAQQGNAQGRSSLSDQTLSALLTKLTPLKPEIIGLDIYRSFAAQEATLARQLATTDNLLAICKIADETTDTLDQAPPPEITDPTRIGASDFVDDERGGRKILRRHLLYLNPVPGRPCQSGTTFSSAIALRYLEAAHGITLSQDNSRLGKIPLPFIQSPAFGGYHNLDTGGLQILLNYRQVRSPEALGCGNVVEAPADCLTVSQVLDLEAEQLRQSIEGRIVLIGTTDLNYGFQDRWPTPYTLTPSLEDQPAGVFLQAQMISQLLSAVLEDRPLLTSWSEWQEMLWITGWAIGGGLIGAFSGSLVGYRLWLQLAMTEGALLLACGLALGHLGLWLPWVPGAIALPIAALGAALGATPSYTRSIR